MLSLNVYLKQLTTQNHTTLLHSKLIIDLHHGEQYSRVLYLYELYDLHEVNLRRYKFVSLWKQL